MLEKDESKRISWEKLIEIDIIKASAFYFIKQN